MDNPETQATLGTTHRTNTNNTEEEHAQNTAGWVNESPQKMGIIDG
jgi:hypothetical protein